MTKRFSPEQRREIHVTIKDNPDIGPKALSEVLKKRGINVTPNYVSSARLDMHKHASQDKAVLKPKYGKKTKKQPKYGKKPKVWTISTGDIPDVDLQVENRLLHADNARLRGVIAVLLSPTAE